MRQGRYHKNLMEFLPLPSLALALTLTLTFGEAAAKADILSLEDYQSEVKRTHQGFQGALKKSEGSKDRSVEGELLFSPSAFSEIKRTDDKRPTIAAAFQGNQTITEVYSLGISQQTRFGLTGRLAYDLQHIVINGALPTLVPQNQFYNSSLGLELTQSLWKNGLGKQVRLQEHAQEASALSSSYAEQYNASLILAESETRYWKLAIAREVVRLQTEGYERSLKIKNWQEGRVKRGLSDQADLLQAEAAFKGRELELKASRDDERLALKAFNEFRNQPAALPVPELSLPDAETVEGLSIPERAKERNDVVSARYTLEATEANWDVNRDRQLPTLDAFASTSLNGRDPNFSDSTSRTFTTRNPLYTVGIRFNVPLEFGNISSVRSGYFKEIQGADLAFQRRLQDQENEWSTLLQQLQSSKERLRIALELEEAQKLKLQAERERFNQARSTTYQISLFEQDYVSAQLNQLQILFQLLSIRAQMKTFEAGKS